MGFFGRFWRKNKRRAQIARADEEISDSTKDHLLEFIRTRKGVEAWVENATNFNRPSILLIAADGESTRRSVESESWAFDFAAKNQIPVYQAGVVPYPQRKRDYDQRSKGRKYSDPNKADPNK